MRKAQAAVELMVITAFMMMVLFLLFEFGQTKINENTSVIQVSQARNTVDRLARAAIEVHTEGVGARRKIYVTIPDRVNPNRIMIGNGTITLGVYVANGTSDVSSQVGFTIAQGGYFPTTPGSYWVWVISRQGYVQIGSTMEINPLNAYFEIFPSNSTSTDITFTNYGISPINVSLALVWTDSEVGVKINGASNLDFTLLPDTPNAQGINLSASAYLNASRGLHNGYLSVTTNISESELIPILVNIVAPSPGAGGVSYLALDLYNDSTYTNATVVFSTSLTLYYKVMSYNSTDDLVNSTVTVRIYNPLSILLYQQTSSPSAESGVYNGSYTIPYPLPGLWKVTAYEVSGASTAMYFTTISISVCSTLNQADTTYYLTADIINSNAAVCMNITADNITLDCQGKTIDSNGVNGQYGVYIYRATATNTNITVRNCVITDWRLYSSSKGVYLYSSSNNSFYNNTVNTNSISFAIESSSNNSFYNNTVNTNLIGFDIDYSSNNNSVYNNIVSNNTNYGFLLSFNSNNSVYNNIVSNNNLYGVYLYTSSNNSFYNNTVNTTYTGFAIKYSSNNNSFYNNIVSNNTNDGFSLYSSSNNNSIYNNTVSNNTNYGFSLYSSSNNNSVYNNIVSNNNLYGVYLYSSSNNSFYNNLLNNSVNVYFAGTVYLNFWNTTNQTGTRIYYYGTNIGGNYWTNSSENGYSDTCTDADHDGFCDATYDLCSGTCGSNNTDYLPLSNKYTYTSTPIVIGTTTTIALYSNQRAICRDESGIVHVVWQKDVDTIAYANSSDGVTWRKSYTIVNSTGSKNTPSVSCNGNNITVAYANGTSTIVVYYSTNNGATFTLAPLLTTNVINEVLVERRGQNFYVVWGNTTTYSNRASIMFVNSTNIAAGWGPITTLMAGTYTDMGTWTILRNPSLAVNGTGTITDKLYVSAAEDLATGGYGSSAMVFKNSSNAGGSWSSLVTIDQQNLIIRRPSITYYGDNVYISYYESVNKNIYFANSTDGGVTWNIPYIVSTGTSTYPSVTINTDTNPCVFWQQNNGTVNMDNVVYNAFNGSVWNSQYTNMTTDYLQNQYVNTRYDYDANGVDIVWMNGTISPYNITYTHIGTCTSP